MAARIAHDGWRAAGAVAGAAMLHLYVVGIHVLPNRRRVGELRIKKHNEKYFSGGRQPSAKLSEVDRLPPAVDWHQGSATDAYDGPVVVLCARPTFPLSRVGPGDVAVLRAPYRPDDIDALRVKRAPGGAPMVNTRNGFLQPLKPRQYWLEADHGALGYTEDSEAFGPVTDGVVLGKALAVLWPPSLAGIVWKPNAQR